MQEKLSAIGVNPPVAGTMRQASLVAKQRSAEASSAVARRMIAQRVAISGLGTFYQANQVLRLAM